MRLWQRRLLLTRDGPRNATDVIPAQRRLTVVGRARSRRTVWMANEEPPPRTEAMTPIAAYYVFIDLENEREARQRARLRSPRPSRIERARRLVGRRLSAGRPQETNPG